MNAISNKMLLSGNHAVSWAVRLVQPDVAPVYPITPQTPILEKITEFEAQGFITTELVTPESEHSAMAAAISASLTGARVFTATSSQGLLLMHELLHYASGARAPIVMFNVNRTPASPWGFWPDQLDSLSQRDTGWIQLYSESPQESLDSVIQAYRIAEAAGIPTMISHDAFYVSHSLEVVDVPSEKMVRDYLPDYEPIKLLDVEAGRSFGAPIDQMTWNRSRQELAASFAQVEGQVNEAGETWGKLTSRPNGALEEYRTEDAEVLIVTMGSMCGTARVAIDALREQGIAAGLLKVRLFRPLPAESLRKALQGVPCAMVIDRNYSPGMGGILHQELKGALYGISDAPRLHGFMAGVGGVNVPPEKIVSMVTKCKDAQPSFESQWAE